MSTFERYLTLWVALCIVAGIAFGQFLPGPFQAIGTAEIAKVNSLRLVKSSATGAAAA